MTRRPAVIAVVAALVAALAAALAAHGALLEVHMIAHSHCDAGWKRTVEQYYDEQVRRILSNVVAELRADAIGERRFVWAEMVFFARWFGEQDDDTRAFVRGMVDSGRFEIVHGGWVMDDEASTLPIARVNQLTLGHEVCEALLGVRPTVAWSIDPFGSASSSPTLLRAMGFDVYVNDRISLELKYARSASRELQFLWQGSPSVGERSTIFTHTLDSWYWVPGFMNWDLGAAPVTDANIASLARDLVRTINERAAYFRTGHLLFPFGHDFAFDDAAAMFSNLDALKTYINERNATYGMHIKYATLTEYFDAVRAAEPAEGWPRLDDADYLPFEDIPYGGWWAGHFTSRPQLKRQMRRTDAALRAAEAAVALRGAEGARLTDAEGVRDQLTAARQSSALMNHHDAATGTSKQVVVDDYLAKLVAAEAKADDVLQAAVASLAFSSRANGTWPGLRVVKETSVVDLLAIDEPVPLLFFNSLGFASCAIERVRVRVPSLDQLGAIAVGNNEPAQVRALSAEPPVVEVAFERCVPPLGYVTVELALRRAAVPSTVVALVASVPTCGAVGSVDFAIESAGRNRLEFSGATGRPTRWQPAAYSSDVRLDMALLEYSSTESGAYLFTPSGPAEPLVRPCPTETVVVRGPLYEAVEQVFAEGAGDLRLSATVYSSPSGNAANVQQYGLAVRVSSEDPISENKELILRLTTDVENNNARLWTDNGLFEMIRHDFDGSWADRIASNYRPLLTTAAIEDAASASQRRALVLVAAEPHGTASLAVGELEIMLQRRLMQDDGLGMDEAMDEQAPFQADLLLLLDNTTSTAAADLTLRRRAALLWDHAPSVLTPTDSAAWLAAGPRRYMQGLARDLPTALHLLSFEARDAAAAPHGIILRLEHMFERAAPGDLGAPVDVDLAALWAPELQLATAEERGLSLGPVPFAREESDATTLGPIETRTWRLGFVPRG